MPRTPNWKKNTTGNERGDEYRENALHGNVQHSVRSSARPSSYAKLLEGKAYGMLDDGRLTYDADESGHRNAADAYRSSEVLEELLGAQCRHLGRYVAYDRDDQKPHEARARGDYGCIFQSDDISETEHCGRGVETENDLELVGADGSPRADAGRYRVGPCAERRHHEVVETSDGAGYGQQFGLVAALFARDEHFGRGRGLGEWVFAVHLLDEVFAEGYEQYDSQESAEERRQEYLVEVGVESQYVERRQREDGSGDYHARAGAYRLYDDILSEHVLLAREVAYADGDDCDRYGGLEYLGRPSARGMRLRPRRRWP